MAGSPENDVIQIRKYPNRRFYDANRSRHVTIQEVHDLIMDGHDVCITDSRNGDDITNLVLMQILLESDQPKLDLFPSSILHMIIRSNRQILRGWLDQLLAPMMGMVSTSQKQWDALLRNAMHGRFLNPMDWAGAMMRPFSPPRSPNGSPKTEAPEPPPDGLELDELRRQVAALKARLDELGTGR